jgi:hypothetical protein
MKNLKNRLMKKTVNPTRSKKNFEFLISKLSENEILNVQEMMFIRGGEGDTNGTLPPPPKP